MSSDAGFEASTSSWRSGENTGAVFFEVTRVITIKCLASAQFWWAALHDSSGELPLIERQLCFAYLEIAHIF